MQPSRDATTIDDVPAEILSHILVTYAADAFERFTAQRVSWAIIPDSFYISWLKEKFYDFAEVTRVCKRWRAVALDCPAFWSNVVVGPYGNTELMLERSKNHPLDVFCMLSDNEGGHRRDESLWLALEHLARFRSFQLCLRRRDADEEPGILYDAVEVPLLEDFTVHFAEDLGDGSVRAKIRRVGRNWVAPRLWRYKVWGGHDHDLLLESWPALQFSNTLTQLVWLPGKASTTLFPSAETVLTALRSLPHLETLQIAFSNKYPVKPFVPLSERLKTEAVHLPQLTRLVLEGHLDTCIDILEHLRYTEPLQQFGVLSQSESKRTDSELVRVADFFAEMVASQDTPADPASPALHTLHIQPDTHRGKSIALMGRRALTSPLHFPDTLFLHDVLSRPPCADLALCLSLPDAAPRSVLARLFARTRLGAVAALHLGVKVACGNGHRRLAREWLAAAQKLAHVHTLAVGATGVKPARLARALLLPPDGAGVRACPYPTLRRVHVTGFVSPAGENGDGYDEEVFDEDEDSRSWAEHGTFEDFMAECIYPLKEQGICLEQLVFSQSADELEKGDLVLLKTELDADVLCNKVSGLPKQKLLYRVPDAGEGAWQTVEDELRSRRMTHP
ncbi:hypothetical protein PsYK624_035310 [Phanerochaete sordida]|uniref:F-box domain-containing protein n=1 Tax=Phanerochaete sordida TaxID=48140 RepID=A0A9P3LAY5_9APHY|nr:hypothetical protein PsYK624_035310 [Phanerochaete sordida]